MKKVWAEIRNDNETIDLDAIKYCFREKPPNTFGPSDRFMLVPFYKPVTGLHKKTHILFINNLSFKIDL